MEGFGEKSYENLIQAAKTASHTTLPRLIFGLGIAGIGLANAKVICRHFDFDLNAMRGADAEELCTVKGIGPKLAAAIIGEREQNGAFRYWEDLLCVRGIGEKTLRKLEGQLGLP